MLSIEPAEFESVRVVQACRISGKEPFSGGKFRLQLWRVFFCIHAWFLFLSREKTQIEAIRLFRVYTSSKILAITEKCQKIEKLV